MPWLLLVSVEAVFLYSLLSIFTFNDILNMSIIPLIVFCLWIRSISNQLQSEDAEAPTKGAEIPAHKSRYGDGNLDELYRDCP